jgi:hypothetical protein
MQEISDVQSSLAHRRISRHATLHQLNFDLSPETNTPDNWTKILSSNDMSERLHSVRSLWEQVLRSPGTALRSPLRSSHLQSPPEDHPPLVLSRRQSPQLLSKNIDVDIGQQTTRSSLPEDSGDENMGILQQLAERQVCFLIACVACLDIARSPMLLYFERLMLTYPIRICCRLVYTVIS